MSSGEPLKSEYLKYIPKKTEYTAYGYIRRNQPSLNCIIAELVYKICLAFYAAIDRWDANKIQEINKLSYRNIKFNADTQTVENRSFNQWISAFGSVKCESPCIYHWRLRIDKLRGGQEIMIGVVDYKLDIMTHGDICRDDTFILWSFASDTYFYSNQNKIGNAQGKRLFTGDIVDVKLDLKEFTLSFMVNDTDYGVIINDVAKDKAYCLGVSLLDLNSQVTLL